MGLVNICLILADGRVEVEPNSRTGPCNERGLLILLFRAFMYCLSCYQFSLLPFLSTSPKHLFFCLQLKYILARHLNPFLPITLEHWSFLSEVLGIWILYHLIEACYIYENSRYLTDLTCTLYISIVTKRRGVHNMYSRENTTDMVLQWALVITF